MHRLSWLVGFGFCVGFAFAAEPATKQPIEVAVYKDKGAADSSVKNLLAALKKYSDIRVTTYDAEEIRANKFAAAAVLIHPGGGGGGQGKAIGPEGREKEREYVKKGGGFVGICAGAYLASADYDWSLHILDAKVIDRKHWDRGSGDVTLKLTPAGRGALGFGELVDAVDYHQGPLLAPAGKADIPDFEPWASFETEIVKNGASPGVMKGTTAIAAGRFGQGRVVAISPHPEKSAARQDIVYRAIIWAAGRGQQTAKAGE